MGESTDRSNERARRGGPMPPVEYETARGLRFAHIMIMATDQENRETAAVTQALARLLIARGVVGEEEWEQQVHRNRGIDRPSA